jgi:hypothetical protein
VSKERNGKERIIKEREGWGRGEENEKGDKRQRKEKKEKEK